MSRRRLLFAAAAVVSLAYLIAEHRAPALIVASLLRLAGHLS